LPELACSGQVQAGDRRAGVERVLSLDAIDEIEGRGEYLSVQPFA
jgi:hypothetical protein